MKIKYGEVDFYSKWLLEQLALAGKKSRMRIRFIEILNDHKSQYEKFRINLIKEHAKKDSDGNIVILDPDENGNGQADIIDPSAFQQDLLELTMEQFVIEENEANKEMLLVLKECIEECPAQWSGESALEYEAVCRLFDDIYGTQT